MAGPRLLGLCISPEAVLHSQLTGAASHSLSQMEVNLVAGRQPIPIGTGLEGEVPVRVAVWECQTVVCPVVERPPILIGTGLGVVGQQLTRPLAGPWVP